MKVELIKQIKESGDVYYATFVDGKQIAGTTTYGGTIIEEKEDAIAKALIHVATVKVFIKEHKFPSESVVYSEEI